MTNKRGGKRPGAGRPKGAKTLAAEYEARVPLAAAAMTDEARKYASDALKVLHDIAADAKKRDTDRLPAAEKGLLWGYGKPQGNRIAARTDAPQPKEKPLGKKEALVQAAMNPDTSTTMGRLIANRAAKARSAH